MQTIHVKFSSQAIKTHAFNYDGKAPLFTSDAVVVRHQGILMVGYVANPMNAEKPVKGEMIVQKIGVSPEEVQCDLLTQVRDLASKVDALTRLK